MSNAYHTCHFFGARSCPACVAVGRAEERAAVVAWLRVEPSGCTPPSCDLNIADGIERGEHLTKEPKR